MYNGIYSGQVVNSADPMRTGRVQVRIPAVMSAGSSWGSVCLAPGAKSGFTVGQTVWVMFEGGDASRPVVMGVKP